MVTERKEGGRGEAAVDFERSFVERHLERGREGEAEWRETERDVR